MRDRTLWLTLCLPCLLASTIAWADCTLDPNSTSNKLLVTSLSIEGTRSLSSTQLQEITSRIIGSCFDNDPEVLAEHIRNVFLNRGYLHIVLSNLRIQALDPIARPKTVAVTADVDEGPRFTLAGTEFSGNRAFETSRLVKEFAMKKGDLFDRSRVGSGLTHVRRLYVANGYLDWKAIPDTEDVRGNTIFLRISIEEGTQYHMGNLEIFAKKELADRLASNWRIAKGSIFDYSYINSFVDEQRAHLPLGFTAQDVQLVRDCRDSSVEVRLPLDGTDPRSQEIPKDIACESGSAPQH